MKKNTILSIILVLCSTYAKADFTYSGPTTINLNWDQTVSSSAPTQSLTLNYVSTGSNQNVASLSGTDASKFKIASNRCNGTSSKTCVISITLNRISTAGTYTAVLNFQNTSPSSINLSSTVVTTQSSSGPTTSTQITFTPSTLPQYTFDTYSTKSVDLVLKNTGTKAISALSNFSWSNGNTYTKFSMERCAGKSLAIGASCSIRVSVSKPPTSVNTALSYTADGATASISFDLIGQTPCLFNGKTYQNGQSVSGYSASTVPYGSTCSSVAVTGVCQSGTITPSVASATCSVLPATRCTVDGRTFAHGSTVNGFSSSSVPYGSTCSSVAVSGVCQSGTVTPSVAKLTCTVSPAASCSLNGQTIPHGQSIQAFPSSSVSFGSTCVGETRTCSNGVLSGSNAFSSCSVQSAATCSFGGQTYQHGQSVLGYSVATVPFGQTCSAFTSMGLCQNGTITNQPTSATCSETQPLTCEFNGQTIQSGGTVEAFETSSVPFGETCKKEVRGCTNGVLTGTFTNTTCTVEAGATCSFGGQTYQHGASVPGFSSPTATYANKCTSVAVSGTCQNGTITNQPASATCIEDAPRSCLYNQQIIAHGSLASGYTQSSAPSGSSCSVYSTTSLCEDGSLVSPPASATCYVAFPEWISPADPNLAVCQGSSSLQSSLICHKDSIIGEVIPNTECSAAIPPAPTVFQSPAGNVVESITNGTETKSCSIGSTDKVFVSRSCDSGFSDNGSACVSATYTATYSSYSPDPSTIQPCEGNVVSNRSIVSCTRDSDQALVSNSFCSDPNPSITTPSPVGYFDQTIANGVLTNQCASGSTQQTFFKRTCSDDYYSTTQDASGFCSLRYLMYTGTRFGDYEVLVQGMLTSPNIGTTSGTISTTKDVKSSGMISNWDIGYRNSGVMGTLNDRYLFLSMTDYQGVNTRFISLDRVTGTQQVLQSFSNTNSIFRATLSHQTIFTKNFQVSAPLNGYVFYKNNNPSRLMKTNGLTAGTSIVKTFDFISLGQEIVIFDNKAFFFANNGTNGIELWSSDGTESGTTMITDLNPGSGSALTDSAPSSENGGSIAILNNKLFFRATNGTTSGIYSYNYLTQSVELFLADSVASGSLRLVHADYNSDNSSRKRYFNSSKMFISGSNGLLYLTDGTVSGTNLIINGTTGNQSYSSEIGFSSTRFFFNCFDLRIYAYAICSIDENNVVRNFSNVDDNIIDLENFGSSPGFVYNSLSIIDPRATNRASDSKGGAFVNNDYYFMVDNENTGGGRFSMGILFKISNDQLYAVKQITPVVFGSKGSMSNISTGMYYGHGYNNKLYFTTETDTGRELWVSDGTTAGTVMHEINSTVYSGTQISADVRYMTGYNGKVYFSANRSLTPNSRSVNPDPRTNYYYMPLVFDPANSSVTELFNRSETGNGDPTTFQKINNFFKF